MADNNENASYEFALDKSNWEPPKTNYLNTIFAEHEKIQDFISNEAMNLDAFEKKVRVYLSMLKKKYRDPILNNIKENFKKNCKDFKEMYERDPDKGEMKHLHSLALIDALGEGTDALTKYYDADGNELGVFAYGMFGYDEKGNPYCLMDVDRAWEYIQIINQTLEKKEKNGPPRKISVDKVPVEVPFDQK